MTLERHVNEPYKEEQTMEILNGSKTENNFKIIKYLTNRCKFNIRINVHSYILSQSLLIIFLAKSVVIEGGFTLSLKVMPKCLQYIRMQR